MIRRLAMIAISGIVIVVIGMQAAAVFRVYSFWPFIEYAMYRRPHQEGEHIARYQLVATLVDSTETAVGPEDLGLNFWKFHNGPVTALLEGDEARAAEYVAVYQRRGGGEVARIRLENHPVIMTRDGLVTGEVVEVRSMRTPTGSVRGE